MLHAGRVTGRSLCSGCHSPRRDEAGPQGVPPAPVRDPWGDRSPASNREERQCFSQKAREALSHWRGSPMGCQHPLPANGGLSPQPPPWSRDKTCPVVPPDLPSAHPHPRASPSRGSSSLGTLCLHHHHPQGFISSTKAMGTTTLQAASQKPGGGGANPLPWQHPPPSDRDKESPASGASSYRELSEHKSPGSPIRSSSQLPAGALDRGPGTSTNKHRSSPKLDMGGMRPGSYCPGECLPSNTSTATMGSPMCWGGGGDQGRLPEEPTQAVLGIKPSGGQQQGGFVPPPLLLPFSDSCSHLSSNSGICGIGDPAQ